jgi:cysteine desulfurase
MPFLQEHFGNPSSGHAFGRPCAAAVATARTRVAALLGCSEDEVVFTSCGSESDNHAIVRLPLAATEQPPSLSPCMTPASPVTAQVGVVAAAKQRLQGRVPHVVTTNIEHPAVIECLVALATEGALLASTPPPAIRTPSGC